MSDKRQEPVFWIYQRCPVCNHTATTVYTPDLLKGPVESECNSKHNPNAVPCSNKWGLAIQIGGMKEREIRRHLELAERKDQLYDELNYIRQELGR